MTIKKNYSHYPIYLLSLFALIYMSNAVYGTFIPVYLGDIGYNSVQIGSLLAVSPLVAILAQPIWGVLGDRAKSKNHILIVLLIGSAFAVLLHRFSVNYFYLMFIMSTAAFFKNPVSPISDTIALESLENTRWKYGPIRMSGTIGYAIMSIIAGFFAKKNINGIFGLYFIIMLLSIFSMYKLPNVKGHQSQGNKVSTWELFKNKELMFFMLFNGVVQITLGFFYSFFSLYFPDIGGDNYLLGWAMFISAVSEIPFLFFAEKILNKLGTRYTMFISAFFMAIRWLLLYLATNPYIVLAIQSLHGVNFIVLQFSMVTYINQEVPKELRASGQAINGLICMGLSRIVGSLLGGILSNHLGIRNVFLYNFGLIIVSIIVFALLFALNKSYKCNDVNDLVREESVYE